MAAAKPTSPSPSPCRISWRPSAGCWAKLASAIDRHGSAGFTRSAKMRARLNDLVCLAMALAAVTASQANAHGAIAIGGNTSEVAAKGIAVGDGYNYEAQADADARALQECDCLLYTS